MIERPIMFTGEMVRAILAGRKTETRRVMKPQPEFTATGSWHWGHKDRHRIPCGPRGVHGGSAFPFDAEAIGTYCPYGVPGSRIYVKEALIGVIDTILSPNETMPVAAYEADRGHIWTKDKYREPWGWKQARLPSMFMPKRFTRIWLEITGVGVRRVQDMDNNDALAEGTPDIRTTENNFDMRDCFHVLWDSIYAKRGYGWDTNPHVWVIQFERMK